MGRELLRRGIAAALNGVESHSSLLIAELGNATRVLRSSRRRRKRLLLLGRLGHGALEVGDEVAQSGQRNRDLCDQRARSQDVDHSPHGPGIAHGGVCRQLAGLRVEALNVDRLAHWRRLLTPGDRGGDRSMGSVELVHPLRERGDQVRGLPWRWRNRLACQHLGPGPARMSEHRHLLPDRDLLGILGPLGEEHSEHAVGAQRLGTRRRSCGRCGQIVKAATSETAPPINTPGTRDSRAPTGAGTAQETRKNNSTPFAPVATLRPIAVDSERQSATTKSRPAAANVSSDTTVPRATSAAPITVAST